MYKKLKSSIAFFQMELFMRSASLAISSEELQTSFIVVSAR